jgi:hypothetical protein
MNQLHYIVFLLDCKGKNHDGKLLKSYTAAKAFCKDVIDEHYADRIIIGTVMLDGNEEMNIQLIETVGFKNDVKHFNQLNLFN